MQTDMHTDRHGDDRLTERLRRLHETYVYRVNAAVAEDREDVLQRLAEDYTDEALRLVVAAAPAGE